MLMLDTLPRSPKWITPDRARSPAARTAHGWGEGDLAPAFFAES
jgi:hypothetical protein